MAKPRTKPSRKKSDTYYFVAPSSQIMEYTTAEDLPIPTRIANDPNRLLLWNFIVADMEKRQVLNAAYGTLISELVEVLCLMHKARTKLEAEGYVVEKYDDEGNYLDSKPSPWFSILNRQQVIMVTLATRLGLTPRDILFLRVPEQVSEEAIDAAFSTGGAADSTGLILFRS